MLERKGQNTETNSTDSMKQTNKNGEKSEPSSQPWTPVNIDVDNIPIPNEDSNKSDSKSVTNVDNCVPVNDIPTPSNIPVPPESCQSTTPVTGSSTPILTIQQTCPVKPIPSTAVTPVTTPVPNATVVPVNKKPPAVETKPIKHKISKLPMPPGIKQTDLEAIESPPSRTPSPVIVIVPPKPKTPPRKSGIMNLPMPPGMIIHF